MEATSSAGRGVPLSQSQSQSRKQWRLVSETPLPNSSNVVHQGQEVLDTVGFCSIQMDGILGVDDGILQQRIHSLARQREEFQHMEIELHAQRIAKSKIMEMQDSFEAQLKEQTNLTTRLQEQLRDKEEMIREVERKMEDKERELHAVRLDNEAAWAKEDLLREQNKELANFRRERDNVEAERAHHIKQIHDLQEHIQDKERQLLELQEQHRVTEESILYKDEQIRDAQAWMARVQEMDVLQSSTLQAELRERTEQYNQLWLGCQRQFAEMERVHIQTIQQLQHELTGACGINGTYNKTESSMSKSTSNDGYQAESNGGSTTNGASGVLPNGSTENSQSFASSGMASTQMNHVSPSILGMASFIPAGQVALHPYLMHQGGNPVYPSMPSPTSQSHVGHFHSVPAVAPFQQWQNQQSQISQPQNEENSSRQELGYNCEISINGSGLHSEYLNAHTSSLLDPVSQMPSSNDTQVIESRERSYVVNPEAKSNLQQISSHFHEALQLESFNKISEIKENDVINNVDNGPAHQDVMAEQTSSTASPPSEASVHPGHFPENTVPTSSDAIISETVVSSGHIVSSSSAKVPESALLDERALLACIVRTIPPGGKIRISSTLPNRLGKMLAPLHWHDYRKKYGKLEDFMSNHPELFVIDGDYIQLRVGAQGIIAATTAVAKVAAAAAASSPYSSLFPPVAVTPMAHAGRVKKTMESKAVSNSVDCTHSLAIQGRHSNGSGFSHSGGMASVRALSKTKDSSELNGSMTGSGPSLMVPSENGAHCADNLHTKGAIQARSGAGFVKQPGRTSSAQSAYRR